MLNPESPFYLTEKPEKYIVDSEWFFPRPMGKNTLGEMMKRASEPAGIAKKTNHSARKSCVRSLRKAGVPPHKVMQVIVDD